MSTLETFIVIESSQSSLLLGNQCFNRQNTFFRTDVASSGSLQYATGSRASPYVPRLNVHVLKVSVQENNFAQLWLQVKMRSHRAHCSADLLFDKTLTKLPWPEMAHTRKVWGTQQNLEWMAAALLMRCNHLGCWFLILDLKWIQSVCDLYPMYVYV